MWSEAKCGVWLGGRTGDSEREQPWGHTQCSDTGMTAWGRIHGDSALGHPWVGPGCPEGEWETAPGQSPIYSLSGLGPSRSFAQAW